VTVHTVAHYVVRCDNRRDGHRCDAEHLVGPVGSVYAARGQAGIDGWDFEAVKILPDGQKVRRNRDLCPVCRVLAAEIVDDPDSTSGTT
jgi:hypothetical protein